MALLGMRGFVLRVLNVKNSIFLGCFRPWVSNSTNFSITSLDSLGNRRHVRCTLLPARGGYYPL